MSKPDNPYVFPFYRPPGYVNDVFVDAYIQHGTSLLDYFAGQEMTRHEPDFHGATMQWAIKYSEAAKHNYDYAEAMLKERERRMNNENN